MALFVVAYDLSHTENYNNIINALKALGAVHTQESVWYVDRAGSAQSLYNHLKIHVHKNDRLMIVEFCERPVWQKGLPGTKAWIEARFPN